MSTARYFIIVMLSLWLACVGRESVASTAKEVLGEYWNDPLFGVAAAEQTYRVDVLNGMLFPESLRVPSGITLRFIFENRTEDTHILLFSDDPAAVLNDEDYRKFVEDEALHATEELSSADGHVHAHDHTRHAAQRAGSMVNVLSDNPTMTLKAKDQREMLLRFDTPGQVLLSCVLPEHRSEGYESVIFVLPVEPPQEKGRGQ